VFKLTIYKLTLNLKLIVFLKGPRHVERRVAHAQLSIFPQTNIYCSKGVRYCRAGSMSEPTCSSNLEPGIRTRTQTLRGQKKSGSRSSQNTPSSFNDIPKAVEQNEQTIVQLLAMDGIVVQPWFFQPGRDQLAWVTLNGPEPLRCTVPKPDK
jgi:hypothetical protein